jgi:hypothetical protein
MSEENVEILGALRERRGAPRLDRNPEPRIGLTE